MHTGQATKGDRDMANNPSYFKALLAQLISQHPMAWAFTWERTSRRLGETCAELSMLDDEDCGPSTADVEFAGEVL